MKRDAAMEQHFAGHVQTPVGWLEIAGSPSGVEGIRFCRRPSRLRVVRHPLFRRCARQLREYFQKRRRQFNLKLNPQGTPFEKKVWGALLRVRCGRTASYKEIAVQTGRRLASRATGGAVSRNPVAIIIPCHRIIASNGALSGYAFGPALKRRLLTHEGAALGKRKR